VSASGRQAVRAFRLQGVQLVARPGRPPRVEIYYEKLKLVQVSRDVSHRVLLEVAGVADGDVVARLFETATNGVIAVEQRDPRAVDIVEIAQDRNTIGGLRGTWAPSGGVCSARS
jgi:hypothetical protein